VHRLEAVEAITTPILYFGGFPSCREGTVYSKERYRMMIYQADEKVYNQNINKYKSNFQLFLKKYQSLYVLPA
jgi:hypothetical protein